jgi:hypothetical protein
MHVGMTQPLTRIEKQQLLDEIRAVLKRANKGRGMRPKFIAAYQILDRLKRQRREELIRRYARPGQGAQKHFSAASIVARVADKGVRDGEFESAYVDTRSLFFAVRGVLTSPVKAGYGVCRLYRLR